MSDKKIFEAWADKISLPVTDDERRKIFGQRAAKLIRDTCDFSIVMPKLAQIISR